jgi:hypothetical protein
MVELFDAGASLAGSSNGLEIIKRADAKDTGY